MTKQLKSQASTTKKIVRYGAVAALTMAALTGCVTTGSDTTQTAGIVHVVQPGDATKSCSELMDLVSGAATKVQALHESYRTQQTSNALGSAANGVMSGMPNYGAGGGTFGMVAQMFGSFGQAMGQSDLMDTQQKLNSAMQRYQHLTAIYNQRCFG